MLDRSEHPLVDLRSSDVPSGPTTRQVALVLGYLRVPTGSQYSGSKRVYHQFVVIVYAILHLTDDGVIN